MSARYLEPVHRDPPRWVGQLERKRRVSCEACGDYVELDYDYSYDDSYFMGAVDHFGDNGVGACSGSRRAYEWSANVYWWRLADGSIERGTPYDTVENIDEGFWGVLPWGVEVTWRDSVIWSYKPREILRDGSPAWL